MRKTSMPARLFVIALVSLAGLLLATAPAAAKKNSKKNGASRVSCCKTFGQYHPRLEHTSSKSERFWKGQSFRGGN